MTVKTKGARLLLNYLRQKWRFLLVGLILFVLNIYMWNGACGEKKPLDPQQILDFSSGALTPLIAIVVAIIAWQQHKTNRNRLRLELFEKRFEAYKAVEAFLRRIVGAGSITDEQISSFRLDTDHFWCLFDDSVVKFVDQICEKAEDLLDTQRSMERRGMQVEERKIIIEKNGEVFKWFPKQMAEQLKPELAVVDVEMPDMSGVDACRRAVAKVPGMKVILTRIDIR